MLGVYSLIAPLLLLAALFAIIYVHLRRNHNYWKKRNIPYLKPTICGSFPEVFTLRKSIGIAYRDAHLKIKGPYMGIYVLDKPHLLVKDPNLIKSVLIEGFSNFQDRILVTKSKHDTLGSQLLPFMGSPDWRIYRKKISPVHTSSKIKSMYCLFDETGTDLVDYLFRKSKMTDILDFKDVAGRYSTEIITSTAFGVKANTFTEKNSLFLKAAHNIFDFNQLSRAITVGCYLLVPSLVDLFRLVFVDPESASFFRNIFWKTMNQREEMQTVRNDLIDILLQLKKEAALKNEDFDGDKVLAQAITFLLAGFETTSTTIGFVLFELAKNPEIQTKLRKEINEIVGGHGNFTYEQFNDGSLKYLNMVFKECLRKYPPGPFIERKCNKKCTLPGTDIIIEEGVGLYISVMGLHMDPENFPNPEEFCPERFSNENAHKIKPYTYMPFGEGPRKCIGYRFGTISTQQAVARIILNFEVEFCEDTPKKIEFHPRATLLAPLGGKLPLRFKVLKETYK